MNAINDCLAASCETGIRVISLVADQDAAQWASLSKQINLDKSVLCHPITQEAVHIVVDVPHCLKNLRNALQKNNIEIQDGKIAKWQHISSFSRFLLWIAMHADPLLQQLLRWEFTFYKLQNIWACC